MIIAVNFQFKQLERRSLKTLELQRDSNSDLRDTGAMLYQLSYEATHWERDQFIGFISSLAPTICGLIAKKTTCLLAKSSHFNSTPKMHFCIAVQTPSGLSACFGYTCSRCYMHAMETAEIPFK